MARPLKKTYSRTHPYVIERIDNEDGSISYEIWDSRPESYRYMCAVHERDRDERGQARADAELMIKALNELEGWGLKTFPEP